MPSGKKSREQRRAAATPPPVQSKGGTRARQASPRALAIGGGIVAVVIVAIVLALVLGGGSKGSNGLPSNHVAVGSLTNGLPGAADVENEFKGIPQNGTSLGWPSAPVTMTEYIDLQCPICREFETTVFPDVVAKYIRTKKVKVVMKPWAFIGPDSYRGQAAAIAAAKQNKIYNFSALLYDNQGTENTGWLTDQMLYNIAAGIPGLKIDPLFADRNSASVKAAAKQVATDANAQKVSGTPTIFLQKAPGKPVEVPLQNGGDEATLVQYLNAELK